MRAASRTYLPQEPKESETAYLSRLSRSVLTNIYKTTVQKLVGKPLRKPIVLNEDVPMELVAYADNLDNLGTDINVFARDWLEHAINDGLCHVLVDYPVADQDITLAEERDQGIRPYTVLVPAKNLIGWKSAVVNGQRELTQIRIKEKVYRDDPENEFAQLKVERVRVIEPGVQRVYEKREVENGQDEWVLASVGETTMQSIPLVTLYTNQMGFMIAEPALLDMAYLNVAHWQSDSDQRNILHVARVPILFGAGLTDDPDEQVQLEVGPNSMTTGPLGSTLQFVEHSGSGIEAGRKDLEDLESRMGLLGLDLIVRRGQQTSVTATQRSLDQAEVDSALHQFARQLEMGLNQVFDYMAQWKALGKDAGGTVTVYQDFGLNSGDAETVKTLLDMRNAGEISRTTFWEQLKRHGLLPDDFDPQEEWDLLELESNTNLTGDDTEQFNRPGDVTGAAAGHVHVLEVGGLTNEVDGHRHSWHPDAATTGEAAGHVHQLAGLGETRTPPPTPTAEAPGDTDGATDSGGDTG
jgi:hypothetical protein